MLPLTVVIVCKNAEATIEACVQAALQLTPQVVVADTGSTDATLQLLQQQKVQVLQLSWEGYGKTKNKAAEIVSNNWVLSLDADEVLSNELTDAIRNISFANDETVYAVNRLNYLGTQPIHWGEWRHDWTIRLYNKKHHHWNEAAVHEGLMPATTQQKLTGRLHHYTATDIASYQKKLDNYARLSAKKYFEQNKKNAVLKMSLSPLFSFIKNYFLRLGVLDGRAGWQIAVVHARYSYLKYRYLLELRK